MMSRYDYIIADLRLRSDRDIAKMGIRSFAPFAVPESNAPADCELCFDASIDILVDKTELYYS